MVEQPQEFGGTNREVIVVVQVEQVYRRQVEFGGDSIHFWRRRLAQVISQDVAAMILFLKPSRLLRNGAPLFGLKQQHGVGQQRNRLARQVANQINRALLANGNVVEARNATTKVFFDLRGNSGGGNAGGIGNAFFTRREFQKQKWRQNGRVPHLIGADNKIIVFVGNVLDKR